MYPDPVVEECSDPRILRTARTGSNSMAGREPNTTMTTRGCPAARSRVQALYGSTIAGHLHGPDRKLLVRASRKDDKEHVRFVPADETLPRFRIPLTEFPSETKWNRPELKAEWGRELTVKFAEWPPENQLPSATFSPALQSQMTVVTRNVMGRGHSRMPQTQPQSQDLPHVQPIQPSGASVMGYDQDRRQAQTRAVPRRANRAPGDAPDQQPQQGATQDQSHHHPESRHRAPPHQHRAHRPPAYHWRPKQAVPAANGTAAEEPETSTQEHAAASTVQQADSPSKPDATPKKRKLRTWFDEYLSPQDLEKGLADKTLLKGTLHVNAKNSQESWVRMIDSNDGGDIIIVGPRDRNRAFDGDIVAVRLAPRERWPARRKRVYPSAAPLVEAEDTVETSESPVAAISDVDDVTAEMDDLAISDSNNVNLQRSGAVVGILSRSPDVTKDIIGHLNLITSESQETGTAKEVPTIDPASSIIVFTPVSKKYPRGYLSSRSWPRELMSSDPGVARDAWNAIYSVSYGHWKIMDRRPVCHNLRCIGPSGHIEPETEALLRSTKIFHQDTFPPTVTQHLQAELGISEGRMWEIPSEVIANRRDLRNTRIFSIDPLTAKDLDDALSITEIDDNTVEIGVHIADVSYFVREGSPVDLEARKRCTSVYLVQKVIPMLPSVLCEQLCSLNPGVDRLAFSVVWRMTKDGRRCRDFEPWFGRTVIRSCAKLDYGTAQKFVDGVTDTSLAVSEPFSVSEVANDCKLMMKVAMARRAHRFETGSLRLDRPKMCFQFDADRNPIGVQAYTLYDSNRMIEEYMLLANTLVAEKLSNDVPEVALLRRHEAPVPNKLVEIVALCNKLGYSIDGSSAHTLHQTLETVEDINVRGFIYVLISVAMRRAQYFCVHETPVDPDEVTGLGGWAHYALGFETYTHFTSPIRRYADIIVHRMLEYCISEDENVKALPTADTVRQIADRCNDMKFRAKAAEDMSLLMFLGVLVKEAPLYELAYLIDLGVRTCVVYIPRLGLEERLFLDKIQDVHKAEIEEDKSSQTKSLVIDWKDHPVEKVSLFEPVRVQLSVNDSVPFRLSLSVLPRALPEQESTTSST
ncbi:hypothetical protein PBRA_006249 [Plasmodiophora brassicae]|uniref:RNB domain-containing protein n=1 Tax=Plasmodiophora brassicae TaxID=37360 RepID=A0A0G4ISC5_PLABS|nr:hypothetical protein PBRA_006249 [Plasmodiophora brassicae]